MVTYRTFRNDDPPGLVSVWNEAFTGRGAVVLRHSSPLERHTFSKPYFDREGLIVAVEDRMPVGFVHAGFGPNHAETALSHAEGVICAIGVRPSHQRRGIGSELLQRAEHYLRSRGARAISAGPMRPLAPFYFGLYGGSDLAGFLASDPAAAPFLEARGYRPKAARAVFQRRLDRPVTAADPRFIGLRRNYHVRFLPWSGSGTWWQECVLGNVEPLEFRLEDAVTGQPAARAAVWEMEGFSWRWGLPAVGILDVGVEEGRRRQGLAKYLLASILQYLQEQYFGVVETHAACEDAVAAGLLHGLGFTQVDLGKSYFLEGPSAAAAGPPPAR